MKRKFPVKFHVKIFKNLPSLIFYAAKIHLILKVFLYFYSVKNSNKSAAARQILLMIKKHN